jgi:surface antigen
MSEQQAFLKSPLAIRPTDSDQREGEKVRVISVFLNTAGQICRVVESSVRIKGHRQIEQGTICRISDGSWSVSP